MNTVRVSAANVELARPVADNTLRSRTSGVPGSPEPREGDVAVATVRPRRPNIGYALLAIAGAGFALVLVVGSLVVRWVYRLVTVDESHAPRTIVTAEHAPAAVPASEPVSPPPVVAPPKALPVEAPPASANAPDDVSNEKPPRVPATSTPRAAGPAVRPTVSPAAPPASASPVPPSRPGPPDMGF
jgi:hypothetical protein